MANAIPLEVIKTLLGQEDRQTPPQVGPIKFYDKEMRCGSRGCSSSTYIKFRGMPKCMMHTIRLANELMVEHGIND